MNKKYTPIQRLTAWKLRKIDEMSIEDIMRTLDFGHKSPCYSAIQKIEEQLRAPRTLRAFMNIDYLTEEDVAVELDFPVEVIKSHLEGKSQIEAHEIYYLLFNEKRNDFSDIDALYKLENEIRGKVIKQHESEGGDDIHVDDRDMLIEELTTQNKSLQEEIASFKREDPDEIKALMACRDELQEKIKKHEVILKDRDEQIISLTDALRKAKQDLHTQSHNSTDTDTLRQAYLEGVSIGEENAVLNEDLNRKTLKQGELERQLTELRNDLGDIRKKREEIDNLINTGYTGGEPE